MILSSCCRSGSSKLLPLLFKFFALAAFVAGMAVSPQAQDKVGSIAPFVAVRVFQIDSVHTPLHGISQNQPRVSAGVVFHF